MTMKRRDIALQTRICRLKTKYDMDPDSIPSELKLIVFQDYIKNERLRPITLLRDIRVRMKIARLAMSCATDDLGELSLYNFIDQYNLDNETEVKRRVSSLRDVSRRALEPIASLFVTFIQDPKWLKDSVGGFFGSLVQRDEIIKQNKIRFQKDHLVQHLSEKGVSMEEARAMLESPVHYHQVQRYLTYDLNPMYTARRISEFHAMEASFAKMSDADARMKRYTLLKEAFDKAADENLEIRSDSTLCYKYLNGEINMDLFEIVGLMWITKQLFGISHVAWSVYKEACNNHFRSLLIENYDVEDLWDKLESFPFFH